METLAWYFPIVTPSGVTLRVHWGTTIVALQIGVALPEIVSLPEERRAAYLGSYRLRITPPNGTAPYDVQLRVRSDDGVLKLSTEPAGTFGGDLTLVPVTEGRFHVTMPSAERVRGLLFDTPGMLLVFEVAGGHARTVKLVGYDGVMAGVGQLMQ